MHEVIKDNVSIIRETNVCRFQNTIKKTIHITLAIIRNSVCCAIFLAELYLERLIAREKIKTIPVKISNNALSVL